MLPKIMLTILCCPETQQSLSQAGEDLLRPLNERIKRGTLVCRSGEKITKPIEAGLVRSDGQFLYPVRDGIPIMLMSESIPLKD
jgi:uncharacterized protein YbaR (Trm112 family)